MRSPAIRTLQVWAVYVFVLGVALLAVPNAVLRAVGVAETDEVWLRVVGMVVIVLGILYSSIVRRGDEPALPATVYARWFAAAVLAVLAVTAGPWQLLLFGVLDLVAATWTFVTLRGALPADAVRDAISG